MTKRRRYIRKTFKRKMIIGLGNMVASAIVSYGFDRKTESDPYTFGTIGGIFALGGLMLVEPISAGIGAGMFNYAFFNMFTSARIFRNDFGGTVYVLAENIKGKVYKLLPFSTDTPYGIDGLAIPSFRKDAVFKVPNGVKVVITREGNIKVLGIVAKIVTKVNDGGWVSKFDAQRRGRLNDGHWSELFKVLDQA